MKLYRLTASDKGPTKLFVGGLHGKEGAYTAPILECLAKEAVYAGTAIIVPRLTGNSTYIGVLTEEYYRSEEGLSLLQLIRHYKPAFYFELHAYGEQSYSRLTDPEREKSIGVPPFVDLGNGILIGSIAPILRRTFCVDDFCVTLEVPNWRCEDVRAEMLRILRRALRKEKREDVLGWLRMRYPAQLKKAELLFKNYYRSTMLKPF